MNGHGADVCPYSYDYEQEPEQSYWVMGHNEEMPKWQDRGNDYWDDYRNTYPQNEYHPGLRNHPNFSWKNNNPMPYDANAQAQYNGENRAKQTNQGESFPQQRSYLEDSIATFIKESNKRFDNLQASLDASVKRLGT
ncbi:hypothetical protein OROMI_021740 [Orobanche minor]